MTAKKPIPHRTTHRFVRKTVLLSAAMVSALGVIAAQTAVAGKPFVVPGENATGEDGWASVNLTLKPTAINKNSWAEATTNEGKEAFFQLDGDNSSLVFIDWWKSSSSSDYFDLSRTDANKDIPGHQNAQITITTGKDNAFNIGWDFANFKSDNQQNLPFFANFRNYEITNTSADRYIKHFIFDDVSGSNRINIVTKNSIVTQDNSGNSQARIGLSLANKRGWITFEDSAYLISDFYFDYSDQTIQTAKANSDEEYIAAGVYTAFGASKKYELYKDIFKQENRQLTAEFLNREDISKYGLIEFKQHSVISVTATDKIQKNEPFILNEVFGVFSNEGGTVDFQNGADILVKGRDNHRLVSAIAAASTLGVLDPLKQGTISVKTDSAEVKPTRIWSWSDNYRGDNPFVVGGNESLFKEGEKAGLSEEFFADLDTALKDYLSDATSRKDNGRIQNLRSAVISAHGSTVTLSDEGQKGWFDIRGDILAGIKNGDNAKSNTLSNNIGESANSAGKVARSYVEVVLTNSQSTLVGNIYERHRVTENEVLFVNNGENQNLYKDEESFKAWHDYQYKQEKQSLGGNANIVLSNGATWYPVKTWCGWNFDVMSDGFFTGSGNNITPNEKYELLDKSDQYNLHVWNDEGTGYEKVNNTWKKIQKEQIEINSDDNQNDVMPVDKDRINDLNLVAEFEKKGGIPYQNEKTDDYTTVDNGIYHLTLNGGVVDLSYLRKDFLMNSAQTDLGATAEDVANAKSQSTLDLGGVKKFRIQALSGQGGTINMYAKDQANHDLVIIDELRDHENKPVDGTFDLNLAFWNTFDQNGEQTVVENLSVDPNDPSTFVHVARVPENVVVHAASYGPGRTTYTYYRVEKDEKNAGENQTEYGEGSWTYLQQQDWHEKNVNWFITDAGTSESDPAVVGTSVLGANLGYLMATAMETMRDRRGEAVYNGSQDDGWWIRYTHNNFGMDDFDAETDGFQMGYEYAESTEDGRVMKGLALDVARADVDYSIGDGKSEANRYRLSAYRTYLADNGFYFDLVGRAGWYDADTDLVYQRPDRTLYSVKGDFDYWAAAASAETGWRYETEKAWWIEPEAQLQFTYIADYDYTSNQGVKVEADDVTSLIGRIGLRAGKVLTRDNVQRMSLWLGADVLHEFDGDREGSMQGYDAKIRYSVSGDDTWCDAVFGMTWETGKDSRLWSTVKHNFGCEQDETWSVNAGATWNF